MNAAAAQPAIRRRRLLQVVELSDSLDPRFVHGLPVSEYGRLLGCRSRLVKTDDTPAPGAAWYVMLNVPGLIGVACAAGF